MCSFVAVSYTHLYNPSQSSFKEITQLITPTFKISVQEKHKNSLLIFFDVASSQINFEVNNGQIFDINNNDYISYFLKSNNTISNMLKNMVVCGKVDKQ